jgi:TatD DNase family protein
MFDAHTHLQDTRFDGCRAALLQAAAAAGVTGLCTCGTAPDDWDDVARLAADRAAPVAIHPAFGVHPWYGDNLPPDWLDRLDACLLAHPGAAVGEIGIDGLRRDLDPVPQRRRFLAQLELAVHHRRTVVVHGARCWGALADLLQPYAARLPGLVLHAFAASEPLIRRFRDQGACFSFAGSLCHPHARHVQAAAAAVPLDRILIETDTPDILPPDGVPVSVAPEDPPLNQPANLPLVARVLARIRGLDTAEAGAVTERNARRVYGLGELT